MISTSILTMSNTITNTNMSMDKEFQIYIGTLGGSYKKTLVYDCSNKTKVKDIKDFVFNKTGIPTKLQNIKFSYKYLENNKTLDYYGIGKEATLNVMLRLNGGGKNKKTQRSKNRKKENQKRELEFKTDGQEYGQVTKILGNGRMTIFCCDGKERMGTIRGKMRKRVWIRDSDYVLVSLRDFQDEKCIITFKYTDEEVRNLKIYGEIPDVKDIRDFKSDGMTTGECPFDFDSV